jgi:hypothetical protein
MGNVIILLFFFFFHFLLEAIHYCAEIFLIFGAFAEIQLTVFEENINY